ncbi:hypothetical protein NWP17_10590 [Chrysosporum bergii ANA360D]|uniref:Uncharacterized protein n=1 Tax=Chrysosporum bergii ANA360D TaxID=617107 RepID=A0AA43KBS9_9CYAN|nr:hypothetical protein [Chrysosporum bergii]MDH6060881.1 hypothetical protein [Chrysosporum bergii ANA360D]
MAFYWSLVSARRFRRTETDCASYVIYYSTIILYYSDRLCQLRKS